MEEPSHHAYDLHLQTCSWYNDCLLLSCLFLSQQCANIPNGAIRCITQELSQFSPDMYQELHIFVHLRSDQDLSQTHFWLHFELVFCLTIVISNIFKYTLHWQPPAFSVVHKQDMNNVEEDNRVKDDEDFLKEFDDVDLNN